MFRAVSTSLLFGSAGKFYPSKETVNVYFRDLKLFLEANDIGQSTADATDATAAVPEAVNKRIVASMISVTAHEYLRRAPTFVQSIYRLSGTDPL